MVLTGHGPQADPGQRRLQHLGPHRVDEDGVPLLAYTPLMVGHFVVLVDAYPAPELHQDEGAAIPKAASDIYSLGGVINWVIRFPICACVMITVFQIRMGGPHNFGEYSAAHRKRAFFDAARNSRPCKLLCLPGPTN